MSLRPSAESESSAPALWPWDDLEKLGCCPVCSEKSRAVRLAGLRDKVFGVAPGEWTLYQCDGCRAAYLDPRPDETSIGRAYARYYTHEEAVAGGYTHFWQRRDLRSRLKTAYLNRRYSYRFPDALPGGAVVTELRPRVRASIDYAIRHLPAPRSKAAALLDIGCGSGSFVATARALGFRATGIDPDPTAIETGRREGLDLHAGSLAEMGFASAGFDHITLNHVFEHLHRPRDVLARCFDLLAPGGRIWISQPNLGAIGLREFGSDWRGLEAPRHLTLFDFECMEGLLADAGFVSVRLLRSDEPANFYFRQSARMRTNRDPYGDSDVEPKVLAAAEAANRAARRCPELGESFTVVAFRPKG